jgi:hypothetical protein
MMIGSSQTDYLQKSLSTPRYKFNNRALQSNSNTTISVGGGLVYTFELPANVYNLSESVVQFLITPALTGLGAGNYNTIHAQLPFRRITLSNSRGAIVDLQEVHKYFDLVKRHDIPNQAFNTTPKTGSGTIPFEGIGKSNLIADNLRPLAGTTLGIDEPRYLFEGGNNTATPLMAWSFKMKLLVDTLFSVDKDIFFNEIMYLRFYSLEVGQCGYYGTTVVTVATGALNVAMGISNFIFQLAEEQNELLVNQVKELYNAGELSIMFPDVISDKFSLSTTSQTFTKTYRQSDGKLLKRIITAPYNATESSATTYDHSNASAAKITSYYTKINGVRVQDNNLICASYDDWVLVKDRLKGSMIANTEDFNFNWRHEENFMDDGAVRDKLNTSSNIVGGLEINKDITFDLYATTANANYFWSVYSIVYRQLKIAPGVLLVE